METKNITAEERKCARLKNMNYDNFGYRWYYSVSFPRPLYTLFSFAVNARIDRTHTYGATTPPSLNTIKQYLYYNDLVKNLWAATWQRYHYYVPYTIIIKTYGKTINTFWMEKTHGDPLSREGSRFPGCKCDPYQAYDVFVWNL